MPLTYVILFFLAVTKVMHGYDIDADLARGLVSNDSGIIGLKSNDGRHFSDYPEDCAAVYLNAQGLNRPAQTGIYEIWPREGIYTFIYFSSTLFV